jgi:hypothetical protein
MRSDSFTRSKIVILVLSQSYYVAILMISDLASPSSPPNAARFGLWISDCFALSIESRQIRNPKSAIRNYDDFF